MQHDASSRAKGLQTHAPPAPQTHPACVISACQAPNLMVPTLVAKVKRFPRNPRVRVATARCRDATQSTSLQPGLGDQRKTLFTQL